MLLFSEIAAQFTDGTTDIQNCRSTGNLARDLGQTIFGVWIKGGSGIQMLTRFLFGSHME